MLSDLIYRLRVLFRRGAVETEMNDELRFHFEQEVEKYVESGLTREEAQRRARLAFGSEEEAKEECREAWGVSFIETAIQDLRYGLRQLRRNPGFTAVAVITLALGIGANTAIFSVVNGVLLNPLPYPQPDQLVTLHESKPNFETGSISYPNFLDWQKENHTFSSMAVARHDSFTLTGVGDAEQVSAEFISSTFFSLLGVKPVIGRTFTPDENQKGAGAVALISERLWKRKFGSARNVLGKSIALDGKGYTVVGVIPASFDLLLQAFIVKDVYVPIMQWDTSLLTDRSAGLAIHGIGRLKPGITVEQARADMAMITRNLAAAYPDANKGVSATIVPLKQEMVGDIRPYLLVLLAAVGFVLLIACVNVANLLLARSTGRTQEFAIRAALGAGQARVIRQVLTESVLLAIAGGGSGLLSASWGTRAALGVLPTALPRAQEIGLDSRVLTFTALVSLFAGIFFGLAPALKSSKPDLHETLKEGGRGTSAARHRVHGVFVAVEMAMAVVLLIGAGLMVRSLARLWSVNPGFDPHSVLTFDVSLPPSMNTASPAAVRAAFRALDDTLESTPGVRAASLSWGAIPMYSDDEQLFWLEGQPKPSSENDMNWALRYIVEPHYLKAMGIPLERGRFFTSQDRDHSPPVIVVDDEFARKFFPNQNPIGKRVNLEGNPLAGKAEIVGIVRHANQWGLDSDSTNPLRAEMYLSFRQMPDSQFSGPSGADAVVRFTGADLTIANSIRRVIHKMNAEEVVYGFRTMDQIMEALLAVRRFSMMLLGAFAALALVLASLGIYGVISYLAGQRTHEIGVRVALGAQRADILLLVIGQGAQMAFVGVVIGLVAAFGLTRLMAKYSLLFGVSATDPLTFASVAILLTVVALAACYIPARRATKVDPMVVLRYE